jgi:hypothetical protein
VPSLQNLIDPTQSSVQDSLDDRYTKSETDSKIVELSPPATKSHVEALGILASTITGALPAIDGSALTGDYPLSFITGLQDELDDRYTEAEADARIVELSPPATKSHVEALGILANTITGPLPAIDASALLGNKEIDFISGLQDELDSKYTEEVTSSSILMLERPVTRNQVNRLRIAANTILGPLPAIDGSALTGIVKGLAEYSRGHTTVETAVNSTTPKDVGVRAKLNPTNATQLIRVNWQWSYQDQTEATAQAHRLEYRLDGGDWVNLIVWSNNINHTPAASSMYGSSNLSWSGLVSELGAVNSVLEFRVLVAIQDTGLWILNEDFDTGASSTGQLTFIEAHMYDGSIYTLGTNV